jgi:hypothetical protein
MGFLKFLELGVNIVLPVAASAAGGAPPPGGR